MKENLDLAPAAELLAQTKRVAVLTGAGISAESGIPTFRGEEGLWKKYRAEELATPGAFHRDPKLVWEWYDWRRGIFATKEPNPGHQVIARWEHIFPSFSLITQNIDGLHKRAGSTNILELHGSSWKLRCTEEGTVTENFDVPLRKIPPLCPSCGALLRPHVVWFGESLDSNIIQKASLLSAACEVMIVAGTSAVVQPAASLPLAALNGGAKVMEINPEPTPLTAYVDYSFRGKSGEILSLLDAGLQNILNQKE
ncbi:MAG: NAD-dependent deacylase [Candidatus Aminicenantes bacterium]|jgi:NAD-dependent deacetylase